MRKDPKDDHHRRSMLVGAVVWSCADIKLLLTSLLFLCTLATFIQLFPSLTSISSPVSLLLPQPCISTTPNLTSHPIPIQRDHTESLILKRAFNPVGSAAYLFIQMGAYRGGNNTFAVLGLASKPLHLFSKPQFTCQWIPSHNASASISAPASKILPDWGYGRVYTVVVLNCTFPSSAGSAGAAGTAGGGQLLLHMTSGGGGDKSINAEETMVALEEPPGTVDLTVYSAPPMYDYLYCGSSLYGNLSPQRVREWLAYHVRLFGPKAHFVIHDAGGVHREVMEVLRPWMEKKVVTLQDVREQERFDGYYHNQFLVVNDCLHRYRFAAKWMFFFDIDEFIYVEPRNTIGALLESLSGYTQFTIEQTPMSGKICSSEDAQQTRRLWGMEKLVYRDVKRGMRRDRKYAIQPRSAYATGVHMSQNMDGRTLHKTDRRITYFHYHGTIAYRREPCREFANATEVKVDGTPYVRDDTLRKIAGRVKLFERRAIGSQLRRTRQ